MNVAGTSAVLMNRRGNIKNPLIPATVSELFVFNPNASDIPDNARPKKAIMKRIKSMPKSRSRL